MKYRSPKVWLLLELIHFELKRLQNLFHPTLYPLIMLVWCKVLSHKWIASHDFHHIKGGWRAINSTQVEIRGLIQFHQYTVRVIISTIECQFDFIPVQHKQYPERLVKMHKKWMTTLFTSLIELNLCKWHFNEVSWTRIFSAFAENRKIRNYIISKLNASSAEFSQIVCKKECHCVVDFL